MATVITITGDPGSGKSTVSNLLKERLGYGYVYTGSIQREIAGRYRMTTLELNRYAETHPEIDEEIDSVFRSLNGSSGLIVDSRMAWFFIPRSFKVYLKTGLDVAVKRIFGDSRRFSENYTSPEEAAARIMERKESENKRYMDLYGADCADMDSYDLLIDTSRMTPEKVADMIISAYNHFTA